MTKPTKWLCAQRRLRSAWASAQSSLSAWRNLGSLASHWAHSEDSYQNGRMLRLIWVFAGHTLILLVLSCRAHLYVITAHMGLGIELKYLYSTFIIIYTLYFSQCNMIQPSVVTTCYIIIPFKTAQHIWAGACQNKQNGVRPANTQISLCIHPIWSVFAVHSIQCYADGEDWSNWVDAKPRILLICYHLRGLNLTILLMNLTSEDNVSLR